MNLKIFFSITRLGQRLASAPIIFLALLPPVAGAAGNDDLRVSAECKNGVAHGEYRVESSQGRVRIEGSYADGYREGEFIFYSAGGEKMIALPYTRGLLHGTVTAWHNGGDGESVPKLVSDISAGYIKGRHRTWYENGRPRSDFVLEDGEIRKGETWNPDGTVLKINDHALFLSSEIQNDFNYYERLEQVMDAYPPDC